MEDKILSHNKLGNKFDEIMNRYDLEKRLKIVFDLLPENLSGLMLLDAGCGTGWFSERAVSLGAQVTSLDIGDQLLIETSKKCNSQTALGDICDMPFMDESFDIVISSECIEHTIDPEAAIREISRVTKKGGTVVLTTPNNFWHWSVIVANFLGLRAYNGHENWLGWWQIKRLFEKNNLHIDKQIGFHMFPFVISATHPVLSFLDRYGEVAGPVMVNMAMVAFKNGDIDE